MSRIHNVPSGICLQENCWELSVYATHLGCCAAVFSYFDTRTADMPRVAPNAGIWFIINIPRFAFLSTYCLRLGFCSESWRQYFSLVLFLRLFFWISLLSLLMHQGLRPKLFIGVNGHPSLWGSAVQASLVHLLRYSTNSAWNVLPDLLKNSQSC